MSPAENISDYERLESQIEWYDRKSGAAQKWYKYSKITVIIASALIPVFAVSDFKFANYIVASFGATIAVLEGASHLNQWHHNWITYRSTCEALRHEKYTYMERANPYDLDDDTSARKLLVERVESLISTEHSKWIAAQEEAAHNDRASSIRGTRSPN